MKVSKFLAPVAVAAAVLFGASAANAALIVDIKTASYNSGTALTIADNGAGDTDGELNSIYFSNSNFGDWELAVAIGSGIANPFEMHLSTIVQGKGGEGPITIRLTQTDMQAGTVPLSYWFPSFGGGAATSGAVVSWATYVSDDNSQFGMGQQISAGSGSGLFAFSDMASVPLSGTYSATMVVTYDYSNVTPGASKKQSSLDVHMNVPEPTSIALVGLALLGLGVVSRRKS